MNLVKAASAAILLSFATGFAAFGADATAPQFPSPAAAEATRSAGPKIRFAAPLWDFGKVVGGETVNHEFGFTNTGDQLLEIKDVKTTCGCATSGQWSRLVEPGKSGSIPIELYTEGLNGTVSKSVSLVSNATNPPPVSLQITGTVWWPVEAMPKAVTLSFHSGTDSNVTAAVRVFNREKEPLTLSEPVSNNPRIAAKVETVRPGIEYRLAIRLVPPLGAGNIFGAVKVKTSSSKMPLLEVPVSALLQADVIALPSPLLLPPNLTTNELKQFISIRSFWTNALVLSEPFLNSKRVNWELRELQPGHFFTFTLLFPEGFDIAPGERLEFRVKTNHPQYPSIQVPIQLQPRPTPVAVLPTEPATARATSGTGSP